MPDLSSASSIVRAYTIIGVAEKGFVSKDEYYACTDMCLHICVGTCLCRGSWCDL